MKTIGQQGGVLFWCALCWHLLLQGAFANNFTKVTIFIIIFYYNYYKSCFLGKIVSNIFGNCTVDFGIEVWQMACLSNSHIVTWPFQGPNQFVVLLPLSEKTPIPFWEPRDEVLRKKTSFSFERSDFLSCLPNHFSGFRKLWCPTYKTEFDVLFPLIRSPGPTISSKFWLGSTPQRLTYKKLK